MTSTGPAAPLITRRCERSGTGWSASCTAALPGGLPTRSRSPGQRPTRLADQAAGVPGGATPRRYWPHRSPGARWCRWDSDVARSSAMRRRARWLLDQAPPKAAPPSRRVRPLPRSRLTAAQAGRLVWVWSSQEVRCRSLARGWVAPWVVLGPAAGGRSSGPGDRAGRSRGGRCLVGRRPQRTWPERWNLRRSPAGQRV